MVVKFKPDFSAAASVFLQREEAEEALAGGGHGTGTGGAGGHGMGPSLSFDISTGSFTMNNVQQDDERGMLCAVIKRIDILHRAAALEAIHDSTDSFMEPKCHPETRTEMLKDLSDWVVDTRPKTTILWLYGPAETLFTTIAYQLALNIEWLRAPVIRAVEKNPAIAARSMATQLQELISDPCCAHEHHNPIVILIDGLDECDGHHVQGEILRTIGSMSLNHPLFLRFIVASRPEPNIRQVLDSSSSHYRSFNVEQSFHDVRNYLCDEFSRICRDHLTMQNISLPWPVHHVLEELVQKSSGYFIYASTIIKFIGDEDYHPPQRLAMVQDVSSTGSASPFEALDQLYLTILASARRQFQLIPILCAIVHFNFRLAASDIDKLFGLAQGETRLILRVLHSVLNIPQDDAHEISSHHASFLDFLNNPDHSGNFCVSILKNQISLAQSLLQYYTCPFLRHRISTLSDLIRFIVLLPPSDAVAELFPLIGSVNPEYIFHPETNLYNHEFALITSWLKKSPSAPADVNQLWEDYAFMISIANMSFAVGSSGKHNVLPSPELLRILILMGPLRHNLSHVRTKLDLTWSDLRTTLCSLRPKSLGDEHLVPIHQPQRTSPWAARDLALHLIRKMVKNHADTNGGVNPSASRDATWMHYAYSYTGTFEFAYTQFQYSLGWDISFLIRLSPPCPILYHELWSIPPSEIWSSRPSGDILVQHVSKWLESFPDSTMELIMFWQKAGTENGHYCIGISNPEASLNLLGSLEIIL
ncbi:NACHT domain-containing protein [Mycena sanguinolenta]|uniref:NACHT domain-containing protein n=1 Tax=Mycena sanguinolenta TaxID=230812 RepID=A0A8H7DIT6_9AGAR|nr:NACHT domain-containing protein [Mycena sanguinolenta]